MSNVRYISYCFKITDEKQGFRDLSRLRKVKRPYKLLKSCSIFNSPVPPLEVKKCVQGPKPAKKIGFG